jgi:hypothetical protein
VKQNKQGKKRDGTSRLAWSNVPVTITSLASVFGLFLSKGDVEWSGKCEEHDYTAWRTIGE